MLLIPGGAIVASLMLLTPGGAIVAWLCLILLSTGGVIVA